MRFEEEDQDVIGREMEKEKKIIVIGEDVNSFEGGVRGFKRKEIEIFKERVIEMKIEEKGFKGVVIGEEMRGMRKVVEIMLGDL